MSLNCRYIMLYNFEIENAHMYKVPVHKKELFCLEEIPLYRQTYMNLDLLLL